MTFILANYNIRSFSQKTICFSAKIVTPQTLTPKTITPKTITLKTVASQEGQPITAKRP